MIKTCLPSPKELTFSVNFLCAGLLCLSVGGVFGFPFVCWCFLIATWLKYRQNAATRLLQTANPLEGQQHHSFSCSLSVLWILTVAIRATSWHGCLQDLLIKFFYSLCCHILNRSGILSFNKSTNQYSNPAYFLHSSLGSTVCCLCTVVFNQFYRGCSN